MECRDPEVQQVCFTNAAGVRSTLFAVIVFAANGAPHATYYVDAAGVVVDTSGGTVDVGACDCPKVIVEQACVRINTAGTPLPGTFDTLTVDTLTFTHLHWIYNSTNGFGYPGGTPIPGPNPTPIDMTNVAAVQAVLNAAYGAGQVGYTFTAPSTGIFYALNATIAATQPNFAWMGDVSNYTTKDSFNAFDPVPGPGGIESRAVEVVKTINCDGTISVVLYEQDGTPIAPQPAAGTWTLGDCKRIVETRDVCIDIAGVPTEVWQLIVRDAVTGAIVSASFEDINGVAVTGTIVDCACPTGPATPLLEARNTYTGSGMEGAGFPDKWTAGCGPITWQIRAYDGPTLVYTSAMSPALGSAVDAQNWVNGGGGGGYVLFNSFRANATGVGINNWSLPIQSSGDYLIVVAETASTTGTGGCTANIDYGFANYDIASLGNGNPSGWWDTIAGPTLTPANAPLLGWQIG